MNTVQLKKHIYISGNTYSITNHLLKKFFEIAKESIEMNGRFIVGLSGGKTPVEFYCRLSGFKEFDLWKRTHVFLADERFVPSDDPRSNFKLIKDNLLNYIDIPSQNVHPVPTDVENAALSAEDYKQELCAFFKLQAGELPEFDFMCLGIGEDGHVASLFPGEEISEDPRRLTLPVSADYLDEDRISLTLPVLNNSRHVYFVVSGESKAQALKGIVDQKLDLPAGMINPPLGKVSYLLDRHAAQLLTIEQDEYGHLDEAIYIIR